MDRLQAMSVFVAVADLHGFAPAARKLGLTPSAVTRLISALETHLGLRLLQRTTRAVALTEVGARYLVRARRILIELEEAEALAREEQQHPSGRLTVTAPSMFGRLHVGPLMGQYLTRYPGVTGELMLSDRNISLVDAGIDLAVRIGPLTEQSLIARRMGAVRRVMVATPAYLEANGTPSCLDDLSQHRVIHLAIAPGPEEWEFQQAGRPVYVPLRPHYTTNSTDLAVSHCVQGGGITRVLSYQVAEAVAAGQLRILLPEFETPPWPIHFLYPSARLLPLKVRAFIDLAQAVCAWDFTQV
ncbi:LysR family transcriptional regulator [Elstera litoralis]|uniref:LysR family transcriptional regulator n=1 Tax=Elstera litoralis TaxID=552518 RepID=A0A0F3IVS4_9PROT|nr:LysR family transcriptional regulator [Elstera litoralis]KJV10638.1 LysR family transcriptional regulator [Elstera litoralis]